MKRVKELEEENKILRSKQPEEVTKYFETKRNTKEISSDSTDLDESVNAVLSSHFNFEFTASTENLLLELERSYFKDIDNLNIEEFNIK